MRLRMCSIDHDLASSIVYQSLSVQPSTAAGNVYTGIPHCPVDRDVAYHMHTFVHSEIYLSFSAKLNLPLWVFFQT